MKKILLICIVLLLFVLNSCEETKETMVYSVITDKYDEQYTQVITNGKFTTTIIRKKYYFVFNEVKPYTKTVLKSDFDKFEIGDVYTFKISETEEEYFFEDSILSLE